jgi:DNA/RNA endonuclease G (NUC1)
MYWKVIIVPRKVGSSLPLSVTAFVQDQTELIQSLTERLTLTDKQAKVYQKSLAELERLTQLDFSALKPFEAKLPFDRESSAEVLRPDDIVL